MLSQTVHSMQKRQKSILVIENNAVIQELLQYCLNLSNYRCSMVDAMHITSLTWIENSAYPLPDGIILDVDIYAAEFHHHLDFMRAFCARWQSTVLSAPMPPLILLTTQPLIRKKLQQDGYTVVMKPFKLPALLSGVETALARELEGDASAVEIIEPAFIEVSQDGNRRSWMACCTDEALKQPIISSLIRFPSMPGA
jgi:DNA-binding response OmpR family regulator